MAPDEHDGVVAEVDLCHGVWVGTLDVECGVADVAEEAVFDGE